MMHRDPFKVKAKTTKDGVFRSLFGCAPLVALLVWTMLLESNTIPFGGTMLHFLWTLLFLKVYDNQSTLLSIAG
jgi:hypothetical protein